MSGNGVHYEKKDIAPGTVIRIGVIVFAVATIASLVLLPMMGLLESFHAESDPPTPALARFEPGRQAPQPRLQERPFDDVRQLRAVEQEWLTSYGWVDRQARIVRMPIDEAMRVLLSRGLPARPQPAGEASGASAATPPDHAAGPAEPAGGAH